MRKLKIMEHISLDDVIQVSGDNGDFPCGDWKARRNRRELESQQQHIGDARRTVSEWGARSGLSTIGRNFSAEFGSALPNPS
jgi:hypothetical protein